MYPRSHLISSLTLSPEHWTRLHQCNNGLFLSLIYRRKWIEWAGNKGSFWANFQRTVCSGGKMRPHSTEISTAWCKGILNWVKAFLELRVNDLHCFPRGLLLSLQSISPASHLSPPCLVEGRIEKQQQKVEGTTVGYTFVSCSGSQWNASSSRGFLIAAATSNGMPSI